MTAQQLATRQQRAISKAQALRWTERVLGSKRWGWHVDSVSDPLREYSVSPDFRCTCETGRQGWPCIHAASCWIVANNLQGYRIRLRGAAN